MDALILQQLHDLTDSQTVEALAFNLAWHYALDIRNDEHAYLCERTLRTYRRLVIEKDLDGLLFRLLTDEVIASVGVDTSKQRIDSTSIRSAMRSLNRLGIVVETISKFLRELRRSCPQLHTHVDPELWRKYVDRQGEGCFARATPNESKRRFPEAASDLWVLLEQIRATEATALDSFQLLERVFGEQCHLAEEEQIPVAVVKPPKEICCDNVLNPADLDASYNTPRGVGYQVQIMETYSEKTADEAEAPDGAQDAGVGQPEMITHVAVGKMTRHDGHAVEPALDDLEERGIPPASMLGDTPYGSNDVIAKAGDRGVELIAPSMPPKGSRQGKYSLEDFELDEEGRMLRCPQGQAPLETHISEKRSNWHRNNTHR